MKEHPLSSKITFMISVMLPCLFFSANAQLKPDTLTYQPFVWKSDPPADCPFDQSKEYAGVRFLGNKSGFHYGDTWYPSWASDDNLYSGWTDGCTWRLDGSNECSDSWSNAECSGEPVEWRSAETFPSDDAAMIFYKAIIRPGLERLMAEASRKVKDGAFMHRRLE